MEPKDILTLVGTIVAVGIGVRNWVVTNDIRAGTIRLEEFRSQIREPIQAELAKLSDIREALVALQRPNAVEISDIAARISDQLAKFEFCVQDLGGLFDHADGSGFATGANWRQRYCRPLEEAEVLLGRCTAGTANDIQVGAALASAVRAITDVTAELRARFEHEVSQSIPTRLLGYRSGPRGRRR